MEIVEQLVAFLGGIVFTLLTASLIYVMKVDEEERRKK